MSPRQPGAPAPDPTGVICECGHDALSHHGTDSEQGCYGNSLADLCYCARTCPDVVRLEVPIVRNGTLNARDECDHLPLSRLREIAQWSPDSAALLDALDALGVAEGRLALVRVATLREYAARFDVARGGSYMRAASFMRAEADRIMLGIDDSGTAGQRAARAWVLAQDEPFDSANDFAAEAFIAGIAYALGVNA